MDHRPDILSHNGQLIYYKKELETVLNAFPVQLINEIVLFAVDENAVTFKCINTKETTDGWKNGMTKCCEYKHDHTVIACWNAVELWDVKDMRCVAALNHKPNSLPIRCCILPNGDIVVPSGRCFKIWRLQTTTWFRLSWVSSRDIHSGYVTACCHHPNGHIVSTSEDCTLKVWDVVYMRYVVKMKCIGTLKGHTDNVTCCCTLPNGDIASSSRDHTLRIWNIAKMRSRGTLRGHTHCVSCCCALSNGIIISSSHDCTLKMWHAVSRTCIGTFVGHTGCVRCCCTLHNDIILSGSADQTLKLWNIKTRRCIHTMNHSAMVNDCCVLPNGTIISISQRKIAHWECNFMQFKE